MFKRTHDMGTPGQGHNRRHQSAASFGLWEATISGASSSAPTWVRVFAGTEIRDGSS